MDLDQTLKDILAEMDKDPQAVQNYWNDPAAKARIDALVKERIQAAQEEADE
jgi:hypothetical protein